MITPEQFKSLMLSAANDNKDKESTHLEMDFIMCSVLEELGYEDGIEIFRSTPKWYA